MNNRTLMLSALFALPTLVSAQAPQIPQTPGQKIIVPLSDPTRAGSLHVGVMGGSITVKGANRKDVLIEVRQRGDEDEDHEEDNKSDRKPSSGLREIPQPASFSVEEGNNRVEVSSRNFGSRSNDFVIEVPARFDLELSAVNDGDIVVEGVDGEHEISNVNGEITLDRVGGSVVAHTTNGAVKATLTRVTAGKPMAFTTLNGDVDLTLPATTKANLRLRSDNGQLFTDFDFTAQVADVSESREQGRTLKEIGKYIGGSINGGGPVFELRSFSGDVYVRKGGK
jgi:putative adhesin